MCGTYIDCLLFVVCFATYKLFCYLCFDLFYRYFLYDFHYEGSQIAYFCFTSSYVILFYFILFSHFILFYVMLFYFILFYFINLFYLI